MRLNVCLIRVFQFLLQFCLVVYDKPEKKHIIPDVLRRLASTNRTRHNNLYFELDAFFMYYATLVEISPDLIKCILNDYKADD